MPRYSDPELEVEARVWVEAVLGGSIGSLSLQEDLKTGEGERISATVSSAQPDSRVSP